MKTFLNTLFVFTQDAWLMREGECVLVRVKRETKLRLPLQGLGSIVAFGRVTCTTPLLALCGERGVAVSYLSAHGGRLRARVTGPGAGNVLLRREQYRRTDDPHGAAAIARTIVAAKIANCRTVLQRALRDHPEGPGAAAIAQVAGRLGHQLDHLLANPDLDAIRGLEGDAAHAYFEVFDHLITAAHDDFAFHQRSRRPPLDRTNSLLSFLYTLLTNDAAGAAEAVGLDPAVGFLHRDRPGRPSCALDLIEAFRPFLADRLALSLINLRQVRPEGFTISESGAVLMDEPTRKTVLIAYQKRKQEEIMHPFLNERVPVGLLLHLQARLLARHLRGDLDAYPEFVWK